MSGQTHHYRYSSMWPSAGIAEAGAFRVGRSRVVHEPATILPNLVTARCGVSAFVVERDAPLATWADSEITCKRCLK